MRIRAGIILLHKGEIALMKRVKAGRTYYVVPGGGVNDGEYTDRAAYREAMEELGLEISLERLLAVVERVEHDKVTHLQMYYLVKTAKGAFGSGQGEEYERPESHGTYQPVWLPLVEAEMHRAYPSALVEYLARQGVPEEIIHLKEPTDYPS